MYTDDDVAQLYNLLNPWSPADDFYLALVMASDRVLDVGCGTGALLHRARLEGHGGHLVGVDPDLAALGLARQREDVEWVASVAADMPWDADFDLAIMSGHAFQSLIHDNDLTSSLAAIRRALSAEGQFVFETRNPAVREWESWHPGNPIVTVDHTGREVHVSYDVLSVEVDVVTLTETTATIDEVLRIDLGQLRFLAPDVLDVRLQEAGFVVESRYGDWDGGAWQPDSKEIIIVARPAQDMSRTGSTFTIPRNQLPA